MLPGAIILFWSDLSPFTLFKSPHCIVEWMAQGDPWNAMTWSEGQALFDNVNGMERVTLEFYGARMNTGHRTAAVTQSLGGAGDGTSLRVGVFDSTEIDQRVMQPVRFGIPAEVRDSVMLYPRMELRDNVWTWRLVGLQLTGEQPTDRGRR